MLCRASKSANVTTATRGLPRGRSNQSCRMAMATPTGHASGFRSTVDSVVTLDAYFGRPPYDDDEAMVTFVKELYEQLTGKTSTPEALARMRARIEADRVTRRQAPGGRPAR